MSTQYEPRPVRPSGPGPAARLLSILAVLVFFGLLAAGIVLWWNGPWRGGSGLSPQAQPRPVTARGSLSELEKMNIDIYQQASPSLAQVTKLSEQSSLFGLNVQEIPKGVGSGFVWDEDGHVVTNYHVVDGADAARVTLDHHAYEARQVSADPDNDIAVLWIRAPRSKLHPVLVGTSHDLKVGQVVFALGDPFGLDQTMTSGIVSALNRQTESANHRVIRGMIQTSAPINPGNSGGPLLDSAGRLIGMNTAIVSPSGAFAGIGFAIPVDEINRVVPQLIRHGRIVRPHLGVSVAQDQLAEHLGVTEGALIIRVSPDSPAAKAGLRGTERDASGHIRLGDVIVAVDGKPVHNGRDLSDALEKHKSGDSVTVTVEREGKRQDVPVTL
jgi:S1-C subfamily serine protease